jgi:HlyD family secretion protein
LTIAREALRAAEADLDMARVTYERTDKLFKANVAAAAEMDLARTALRAAEARAAAAKEQLRLTEEGYRRQQVTAAKQGAAAAQAQLESARSRANELVLTAPRAGVVLLVNFRSGELVSPNAPVLTLGDPDSLWMRVFVSATELPHVRLGAPVEVRPIGAKQPFPGRVVSIASEAEFTPRAALTEEEQANLVFGVKLVLERTGGALKAGLPAEARISPP